MVALSIFKTFSFLAEINPEKIEWRLYDDWTPYYKRNKD